MPHIPIISSSVGFERKSHRASLYFKKYLEENNIGTTEILDIKKFRFLLDDNGLKTDHTTRVKKNEVSEKIKQSDGIIIVSPACDGDIPTSFKKIIGHLHEDWNHIPVAIATVSTGPFNRSAIVVALRLMLWKIMHTLPAFSMFPKETAAYDKNGNANNKDLADKHAGIFIGQLLQGKKNSNK